MKQFILFILLIMSTIGYSQSTKTTTKVYEPNVVLQGKQFTPKSTASKSLDKPTEYTYKDKAGTVYPVYSSKNGKLFCYRVSKKTGKEYKFYINQ